MIGPQFGRKSAYPVHPSQRREAEARRAERAKPIGAKDWLYYTLKSYNNLWLTGVWKR